MAFPKMVKKSLKPSSFGEKTFGAKISRLYLAYFLRLPDFSGMQYWMSQRSAGRSLADVSSAFAASPEFINTYGRLDNRGFVGLVYQNVLGRAPDAVVRIAYDLVRSAHPESALEFLCKYRLVQSYRLHRNYLHRLVR